MRPIPPHSLWLGHAGDGRDFRRVLETGIQVVVQLAAEEPPLALPRDLVYCRFPLVDGPGNDKNLLRLAITTIASLLEMNLTTLVVCGAGLSRSPAISATGLALALHDSPEACLRQVTEHFPADVAPGLWAEVIGLVASLRNPA